MEAFKVLGRSQKDVNFLNALNSRDLNPYVTIEKPLRRMNSSYIFTAPECLNARISSMMSQFQILEYQVFNPKFERSELTRPLRRFNSMNKLSPDIVAEEYLSHDEANAFIDHIANEIRNANPAVSVDVSVEGKSSEQREIKSITVKYRGKPLNPSVFIDAGVHAREWHARSMALYFLRKLIEEAALDKQGLIFTTSFIIVPGVNPDGYEFSRQGYKMWRKTRKPVGNNCIGVDGNRNYDAHWYEGDHERDPCSEVYRGTKPFSEPETRIIRNIMMRNKNILMYISIHTFGNTIIYPYGYTTEKHPRYQQLNKIAMAGVNAVLQSTGTKYTADQSGSR